MDKQYYVDFEVNKREAEEAVHTAERFIADIVDLIAKLNEGNVSELHRKAVGLFKDDRTRE